MTVLIWNNCNRELRKTHLRVRKPEHLHQEKPGETQRRREAQQSAKAWRQGNRTQHQRKKQEAAANGDKGLPIAATIVSTFRNRSALLPSLHSIEKIGLGGRAIARRRAERALIEAMPLATLEALDGLLEVDPSIGQTRFHWMSVVR